MSLTEVTANTPPQFSLLNEALHETKELIEQAIESLLPVTALPEKKLVDAMRYACLDGGKRLRPLIVLQVASMFGVNPACSLRVAAAIEFAHCYSLVHDDLPSMDDGKIRRGRPCTHITFGEATAILAGDALQALAFEILADHQTHEDPHIRCALTLSLARSLGGSGMVGGQMLDILSEQEVFDAGTVTRLQRMKTGEAIIFAAEAGAILGKAGSPQRSALRAFGHDLGLAYQITDDVLDAEGKESITGKSNKKDADKATFVKVMGLERAKEQAKILSQQAIKHLDMFHNRSLVLKELAEYVVLRDR
ncbi:MAG: polyprenyl synthetase family protein [Alphaproteobacteria bacterium]